MKRLIVLIVFLLGLIVTCNAQQHNPDPGHYGVGGYKRIKVDSSYRLQVDTSIRYVDTVYGVSFATDRSVTCYRVDTIRSVKIEGEEVGGYRQRGVYFTLDYHEEIRAISGVHVFIKGEIIPGLKR